MVRREDQKFDDAIGSETENSGKHKNQTMFAERGETRGAAAFSFRCQNFGAAPRMRDPGIPAPRRLPRPLKQSRESARDS